MNPCEVVASATALACAIASCVPKEDLPVISTFLGQLAATLATITVQEERNERKGTPPDLPLDEGISNDILLEEPTAPINE